jgi:ectoine hydroxylase-related dioxygenase (phytanoyl-CoA dioxygenase family)
MLTPGSPGVCTLDSLDANACDFYKDNGFLVITNAVTPDGLAELAAETVAVCRGEYGQVSRSPQAVGGPLTDEMLAEMPAEELISHFLCIHHPHKISATFERYLAHPAIVAALTKVIGPNVKCMQSMLFVKSSGKPGQAWHQDEDYIPTRDRSLTGAWIAIDDATVENGCLWVIPGSQRRGILYPQYPHDDSDYDCNVMSYNFPYDESVDAIPVEVPAGSIVFFNGYLLHKSLPNRAFVPPQLVVHALAALFGQMSIEIIKAGKQGLGHHDVPAGVADHPLDFTFIIPFSRAAKPIFKQIMGHQF